MNIRALSPLLALLLFVSAPACGGGDGTPDPDGGPEGDQGGNDQGSDDAGEDIGGGDAGDVTAPVPGAAGLLAASNPTSSSIDLTWTAATDDTTAQSTLEYRVYFSLEDNLDTVADVLANGTRAGELMTNFTTLTVGPLALDQPIYFNVLVRDEAGNLAVYDGVGESTLDGDWQAVETPEDYAGSVELPRFALNPYGDLLLWWHEQPAYAPQVAFRGRAEDDFGEDSPWSSGIWTADMDYGFDGLRSVSFRDMGATNDLVFGGGVGPDPEVFDDIAVGVSQDYTYEAFVCVAENTHAMVVWLDGAGNQDYSLRARFRTENGIWGTTSLVNASEGQGLESLQVVCSPDGNHVVIFVDNSASPSALKARVYDADARAWEAPAFTLTTGPGPYAGLYSATRAADGRVVVVWQEAVDATEESPSVLRARTYGAGTWSAVALLDDSTSGRMQVTAAGNDVHAVWQDGAQLVTSRLDAGSTAWTTAAPIGPVAGLRQLCLAGDSFGGALLAWRETTTVLTRTYRDGWGNATTLRAESDTGTGENSLDCVLDLRKRASVVWTTRPDIASSTFSVSVRTFR